MMRLLWAFLKRDFKVETSYQIPFLMTFAGVFASTITFFFVSRLIGDRAGDVLADYGGDYFAFVLIGIAFGTYFGVGLSSFATALRMAQTTGTLEAMMMTPASIPAIILGSATWSYAFNTFRVFLFFVVGIVFLGLRLPGANYIAALVILILSIIAFGSLGILAASVIMVLKRGEPVTMLFNQVANLIGGIYYPVEILPDWLQTLAGFIPITYSLRALRLALLTSASWAELQSDLVALFLFCLILFPLSLWIFRYAVEIARREGSLAQY